ncbi:MAG: DUF4040 domain-containing protein [Deltaproteobacteria bacterium]|nr:MAG: DUF4040 domain-containing protein [Deltaproteobacteria bacterium]
MGAMTGLLPTAVLLPYAVAALLPLVTERRSKSAGRVASVAAAATFLCVLGAAAGGLQQSRLLLFPWAPQLKLSFSVLCDGLSLLFALLVSAVGVVVATYASAYLDESENRRRFFVYLLLFMGSMLGVVTAGNLISLFVFWELTSVTSFLLIGFWHETDRSRDGALKALVVTSSGGLAMLVGFVITGIVCDSFEIPVIVSRAEVLLQHPLAPAATALVVIGALTKSAQLPFHLWLPSAMEAPTPVSAYLHAATMVKAGLFLAARLGPLFGGVPLWTPVLTAVGVATMTWAGLLALRQRDLKALLAFSTVSQLGLILVLLAPAEPETTAAGLLHVLNHAAFKGALFLLVGVIEHEAHTRDLARLSGIARTMPVTSALAAVAALSMAGVPPLGGFVSKELFIEHVLALHPLLALVACAGAVLTAGYCLAFIRGVLFGHPRATPAARAAHEAPAALLWGPGLLVVAAVVLGPWAQVLGGALAEGATAAVAGTGEAPHLHLALWHGLTPSLAVSAGAIVLGAVVAFGPWSRRVPEPPVLGADRVYAWLLERLERSARKVTQSYMSGLLWRYNAVILLVFIAAAAVSLAVAGWPIPGRWHARDAHAFEFVVAAAAATAALGACAARTRLAAILALGANGYMLAVLFGVLGAPDLALTQVMVETVSVALFLAAFALLPAAGRRADRRVRRRHAAVSVMFGVTVAWSVFVARAMRGGGGSISEYFVDNSVGRAGGHNVVNVILVDFRGLDTLGEISVLAVAALASFAVIAVARGRRRTV